MQERKLLLLSGGVESTAILTTLDPTVDVAVVVSHNVNGKPWPVPNNDYELVKKIAFHYRFYHLIKYDINYNHMTGIDVTNGRQRFSLISAALSLCYRMPAIREILTGFHSDEYEDPGFLEDANKVFNTMFPYIKIHAPLKHLTKAQQWDMIADEVKPYVRSCYITNEDDHDPSTCEKCIDFTKCCT